MHKIVLTLANLTVAPMALAASFNCVQDTSPIEKLICTSPPVSKLDEQLAVAYENALETVNNPTVVQKSQIAWLKSVRKTCHDAACLAASYQQRLDELKALKPAPWKTFRNEALGVQFRYPANHTVTVDLKRKTVTTSGPRFELGEHKITYGEILLFSLGEGDLKRALESSELFKKQKGQWVTASETELGGSINYVPTTKLSGIGWQGVKGTYSCGVSRQWDCSIAVISNGRRYLMVSPNYIDDFEDREQKTLASIRFN
ncbi:hypothetical protein QU481_06055 [Crenobacter sp. SG2303]|uniref:Lysozyme inhibitor LprI N-terminal domain-containing protein n=1 Tax=Crenobacter oryzisoli TaxID=3056844 RepID=A0ABT7XL08_9NEIS|nr:hypothetical protein [Crenobacter sp. SG2303]MDN0074458.1 hypothetical protein [Crenobacter sp. SG2303]